MIRLLLFTSFLLLLVACSSEQKPLPPAEEPASQARVTVSNTGLFEVKADELASLGWDEKTALTLTLDDETIPYQHHEQTEQA